MKSLIIIIIVLLLAITDALFANESKELSKIIELAVIALFFVLMKSKKGITWKIVIAYGLFYAFIRGCLFDMAYNTTAGININFVGSTTYIYDWFMSKLNDWAFWVFRAFYLFIALIIYLKILRYEKIY